MKQLIIARKDLQMSPGKLAAQVSHASMAFLTNGLRANYNKVLECSRGYAWEIKPIFTEDIDKCMRETEERNQRIREHNPDSDYIETIFQAGDRWYTKRPQLYRRNDLYQWARETRLRGEEYFYYRPVNPKDPYGALELCEPTYHYKASTDFDVDTWENWINGSFTKVVCEAKNRYQLEKSIAAANEIGLTEGKDFFLIKDNCLTELTPEEIDANGQGRTVTCIGFRPLPDDIVHQISKKYQLFK